MLANLNGLFIASYGIVFSSIFVYGENSFVHV